MSSLLPILVEYLRTYGLSILGLSIILQCNGIPVGANFLVMASGAFAYAGEINLYSLILGVWVFLLAGDISSYFLWRYLGQWAFGRFPALESTMQPRLTQAGQMFDKYGIAAVSLTRFPFSILGPAINIISGTTSFGLSRFVSAAALGETFWAAFNIGVGYWFGDSWEDLNSILPAVAIWLTLLAFLILASYLMLKNLKNRDL